MGVGIFLVVALLRILFQIPLNGLLIASYIVIFTLAAFAPKDFLAVAFDSRRRDHRAYDRAFHHGAGLGRVLHPKRRARPARTASVWWRCAPWGRCWRC